MSPTIAVVMLTLPDRAKLRQLALACLQAQTRPPDELILATEVGDHLTVTEAAPLGRLCRVHMVSGAWSDVTAKYNGAISETKSDWVTFWDDDDWCAPDRLEAVARTITTTPTPDIVGPQEILYHELIGSARRTVRFETHAHVIDGASAFRRSLWAETPIPVLKSIHPNAARMANIGDWIVKRVAAGARCAPVHFDYVAMIHGQNATMARPFRVDAATGSVHDGPNDFTIAGGREGTAELLGEATLARYEAAVDAAATAALRPSANARR